MLFDYSGHTIQTTWNVYAYMYAVYLFFPHKQRKNTL